SMEKVMKTIRLTVLATGFLATMAGQEGGHGTSVNVIVQFRAGNLTRQIATVQNAGATLYRALPLVHAAAFSIPARGMDGVRQLAGVKEVSVEASVRQTLDDVTPAVGAATAFASGWTGKGIGVAIIDSGVSWSNDLTTSAGASRVLYQQSFTPETITNDW